MAKDRAGFLLDEHGNYMVEGGDFVIGPSRLQEAKLIIMSSQNEWKQHPLVGCNSNSWNNSTMHKQDARRIVKQQLEADGLSFNDYELLIESKDNNG